MKRKAFERGVTYAQRTKLDVESAMKACRIALERMAKTGDLNFEDIQEKFREGFNSIEKGEDTMSSLDFEVSRIHVLRGDGATKAFADITINDSFVVKGVRVVKGKDALFMAMPNSQGRDGKYYDICFPLTKELRQELQDVVLKAYEEA